LTLTHTHTHASCCHNTDAPLSDKIIIPLGILCVCVCECVWRSGDLLKRDVCECGKSTGNRRHRCETAALFTAPVKVKNATRAKQQIQSSVGRGPFYYKLNSRHTCSPIISVIDT